MRLLVGVAALLLSATCSVEAYKGEADGWLIQDVVVKNPDFTGCMMGRRYDGGTLLSVLVSDQYEWAIGIANEAWNMQKGTTTDIAVHVDGKFVASGKAVLLDSKAAILPISGVEAFHALRTGKSPYANLSFTLVGTGKGMFAVVECVVATFPSAQTATESSPPKVDAEVVPQVETMAMVSNLLNSAGAINFRIDTPKAGSKRITFTLADGTVGMFFALRGRGTVSADDHATYLIGTFADICKGGDYLSGRQSVPSTDGSVVRKVLSTCRVGANNPSVSEVTIIRRPDGFLVELTLVVPASAADKLEQPPRGQENRAALTNAAMQIRDGR
jgi:hypothetical protein